MARRAARTQKVVEIWIAQKDLVWEKREIKEGDELTLDELASGMKFNEDATAFYKRNAFTYEKQNGMTMENGSQVPNMETKTALLPIARK